MRKVELTEEDFKVLVDIKVTIEILLDKFNQVLAMHTVRDPAWKGQVVPFEKKDSSWKRKNKIKYPCQVIWFGREMEREGDIMKARLLLLLVALFFSVSDVLAHGGRTDACGGHHDRKRGGYHIHNYSKYCACHPDAPECKKEKIDAGKKNIKKDRER